MGKVIEQLKRYKNIVLYGCGSTSYRVMEILLSNGIVPIALVDGSKSRWGTTYSYKRYKASIISYNELKERYKDYVIVLSVSIRNALEIKAELELKGESNPIIHMQCPFKIDDELLSLNDELFALEKEFYDEESRSLYRSFLDYKASGNMENMMEHCSGSTYFDRTILQPKKNDRFVDVGCYTGDTIAQFMLFAENGYDSIVGMDADPGNCKRAQTMIEYARLKNAHIINMGGWCESTTMVLHTLKNNNGANFDSPNFFRRASDIMDSKVASAEEDVYEDVEIRCDSLDNLFYDLRPTIIKINALAADFNILVGAKKIIEDFAPEIVLDYGARPSFIKDTVKLLKTTRNDYQLFLREKEIFGDFKTILYAVRM